MSERELKVYKPLASVDIYVPDESGEWAVPVPRGILLAIHREGSHWAPHHVGFVAVENGSIIDHPLEWLRIVSADNEQPAPPVSPAEVRRKSEAQREADRALYGPVRKRRAPRKAVVK